MILTKHVSVHRNEHIRIAGHLHIAFERRSRSII